MKRICKRIGAGAFSVLLLLSLVQNVFALEQPVIVEKNATEEGIVLYVAGIESYLSRLEYHVGSTECVVDSAISVRDMDETIYTLVLWDNSNSVMKKCESTVKEILTELVANRSTNEKFSIATMGESLSFLTDYTNDYSYLKQLIGSVEKEDKDAYLIDNLYEAISSFKLISDVGYKRIILISDGMNETEIGYTKKEFDELLETNPYPIYTIGVTSKNGKEELQNMFALSRTTGVSFFCLDEIEDSFTVVEEFSKGYDTMQIKATVPAGARDGSTQNSQLVFECGGSEYQLQCEVVMPFGVQTEESTVEESESVEEVVSDAIEIEEVVEEPEPSFFEKKISFLGWEISILLLITIISAVVVVLVIVVLVVFSKKKRKDELQKKGESYERLDQQLMNMRTADAPVKKQEATPIIMSSEDGKTQMLGGGSTGFKTQSLFDDGNHASAGIRHRVKLVNASDSAITYQCNITDKIVIGRNPQVTNIAITSDNAVSERHCEISYSDGKFFVKDLGSSNGTMVGAERIKTITQIENGAVITLGRSKYKVMVE